MKFDCLLSFLLWIIRISNYSSGRSIALQNRFLTAVRSGNLRVLNECVEQLLSEVPEEPGASMAPGDLNDKTESVINKEGIN